MELPGQFSPESADGQFSFNIGDENFGFEGKFTKGEFVGKIRGGDGKEFTGLVEDLGGGRHRIIDFEGNRGEIESLAEVGQTESAAPAEMSIRLEDAAALAAIDAAPVEEETAVVSTQLVAEAELPTEVANMASVKEPVAGAAQPSASEPLAPEPEQIQIPAFKSEDSTELSSVHPTIRNTVSRLQEIRREVAPQVEEAKRLLAVETEAKNLRRQAEKVRGSINRLRNKDRISEKIAEEGALIRQAKELEDKVGIARSQDKYKEMDEHKAWRLEARKDATIALEADLKQWETVMRNPEDFNFYRQVFEKWQQEGGNTGSLVSRVDQEFRPILDRFEQRLPRRLLELARFVNPRPEGGQKGVDDDIWAVYNQATNQLYSELGGQPATVTELSATPETVLPPESMVAPMVTEPEVVEQQPVEATAPPVPEESAAPAPVEVSGTGAAAGGLSGYQLLEGEQKDGRLLGRFRDPSGQVWEGIAQVGPDGKVTIKGALTEETEAPEPVEASMPGEVVVDIDEQARAAAAKPVEVVEESQGGVVINEKDGKFDVSLGGQTFGGSDLDHTILFLEGWINNPSTRSRKVEEGQVVEALSQLNIEKRKRETAAAPVFLDEQITAPMPDMSGAGIPAAPAEAPAQPEVELTPDQIRERAERRRNNFAGAAAQLEGAYMDTVGTKNERVGRVVEGVREMILAGLELAEEGGAAQEVVMNVLGRLNNEQNRPLVQAAAGQAPEQVERAVGEMLQARGAFGLDGKPKSRKELEDSGLVGLIELLIELGMSFTDASVNAVITEVQSATGAGR